MAHDPLHDIKNYSPAMTISNMLKFFERKGIAITRPMVQNYIRQGLLPPPKDKRFYTHRHIALLCIIERLKTVFDMPAIQQALSPLTDNEGLPLDVYFELQKKTDELSSAFLLSGDSVVNMLFVTEVKKSL